MTKKEGFIQTLNNSVFDIWLSHAALHSCGASRLLTHSIYNNRLNTVGVRVDAFIYPPFDSAGQSVVTMRGMWWDRFVDGATIGWLVIFVIGLTASTLLHYNIQLILLGVFIVDLGVKYRREPNLRTFLRTRWTDILMVIPYFRIFRILKLVRLLRILKTARIAKTRRFPGLKMLEGFRRKSTRLVRAVRR